MATHKDSKQFQFSGIDFETTVGNKMKKLVTG